MKESNWKNFDLCQSNCPLKESYQKNFDFCLSNFPLKESKQKNFDFCQSNRLLKESNRKNFNFCQSCLIQDNCLTLKRSPWIENHLFRDQYSKPTLTSCKSVDWLNFWNVKRLKTIAIFRWTSLPIMTLWVAQLKQIYRLSVLFTFRSFFWPVRLFHHVRLLFFGESLALCDYFILFVYSVLKSMNQFIFKY